MNSSQFGALHPEPGALGSHGLGHGSGRYLLRFESLFHSGRGLSFPCDERGLVPLDQLSAQAKDNYLFARAVVGHEYATPVVQRCDD